MIAHFTDSSKVDFYGVILSMIRCNQAFVLHFRITKNQKRWVDRFVHHRDRGNTFYSTALTLKKMQVTKKNSFV